CRDRWRRLEQLEQLSVRPNRSKKSASSLRHSNGPIPKRREAPTLNQGEATEELFCNRRARRLARAGNLRRFLRALGRRCVRLRLRRAPRTPAREQTDRGQACATRRLRKAQ